MAGFANIREYAEALQTGRAASCSFRKVPSQASTAGHWVDLSMAAGNPKPNYYASEPLVAATLSAFNGVLHGDAKSPASKHLAELMLTTPTAGLVGRYRMIDYLLYYPFVDGDSLDEQVLDNTVTLPRYSDGDGVMAMLVASAPTTGAGQFTFNYVDESGVSRTSPTQFCATSAVNIATVTTSQQGTAANGSLFLRLANGTNGIRQIDSITYTVPDGGLTALVLVKPIADAQIYEIDTPSETTFVAQSLAAPRIYDGAYLNFVMNCAATVAAGTLAGRANFVWSE